MGKRVGGSVKIQDGRKGSEQDSRWWRRGEGPGGLISPWREKIFENENNDILPYNVYPRYTP